VFRLSQNSDGDFWPSIFTNKARDEKLNKHSEKITPVVAALSAVSSLACCVPSGVAAAAGAAGLGAVIEPVSPWFIRLSIVLLAVGFVQLYRSNRTCQRRSPVNIALFLISAIVVLGVLVFPQLAAGLFASVT
jgi:cytochrome bd-type quinol oxidase subunit 2